jgi:hypothetical protein
MEISVCFFGLVRNSGGLNTPTKCMVLQNDTSEKKTRASNERFTEAIPANLMIDGNIQLGEVY